MSILEKKVDLLIELMTCSDQERRASIRDELISVSAPQVRTPRERVAEALRFVGVPCHLVGYPIFIEAVCLVLEDENIYRFKGAPGGLRAALSQRLGGNLSSSAIERRMRNAVDFVWLHGDVEVINRVFGNSVSTQRAKPTSFQFVYTIAEYIRRSSRL